MGRGRTKLKQGPPEPLENFHPHLAKKRKTDDTGDDTKVSKRRRSAMDAENRRASKPSKKSPISEANGTKVNGGSSEKHRKDDMISKPKSGRKKEPAKPATRTRAEADEVYDSGEDEARPIFSDDDLSGSDAEEKLTAANIEGLSRKLDAEK